MRTLTKDEIATIKLKHISSKSRGFLALMIKRGYTVKSDFSGNLFYSYRENDCIHTKPLNICIPELKCEHDEMETE